MFKTCLIGNKQISMKILVMIFICCFGGICYAQGFEESTLNNYLYGPYFNDPLVHQINKNALPDFLKKASCKTSVLNDIYNDFFQPGIWEKVITMPEIKNVLACAWNGKENAYELMEKMVYAKQLNEASVTENKTLRSIIYHPNFMLKIAKAYPKILQVIPDSHPNYLQVAIKTVAHNPNAFNHLTLRFKRHPKVTALLFNAKSTYDDIYKHMAIQYALSDAERKQYIMHNGLLYLELPIEVRDNPYLAYHAYVQNDFVYPYMPPRIVDVFNDEGAIMVPRYMTKLTLIKQKLISVIRLAIRPIKDMLPSSNDGDEIAVNINEEDDPGELEGENEFSDIVFVNERTVVTDIRTINKIETKKKRRLLNLWRIARFGDNGQVFVAMFRPNGKEHLGTIVVKQNERIMFSDYAAVFSMDGESIWRIDDGGAFSAKSFVLDRVVKSSDGYLNFSFSWKGTYTTNKFNLVDQGGLLIKEFINYYFE